MNAALMGPVAVIAAMLGAAPSHATVVGGGGSKSRDCLVVFDAAVNHPISSPRNIRCTDGDPTCDADQTVDGVCTFELSVCVNSAALPGCVLNGVEEMSVDHAEDDGDPKFDPDFQALQSSIDGQLAPPTTMADDCTAPSVILVPIKGPVGNNRCSPQRKKIKLRSRSQVIDGRIYLDNDKIKLTCLPDQNACDPQVLFADTADRIQKQILNQGCALSSCHDSQSTTGNLLLETGASFGNLVNVAPDNTAAGNAGWLRVDAPNPGIGGSAETSYLYRKINGDLPDASYGSRMPLGKPKLNKTLRDVIELWIEAGAPQGVWVPGTD
jgi:hypothetical protein